MTLSNSSWIQISSLHSYCKEKDIYIYIYSYKIVRAFTSNYAKKQKQKKLNFIHSSLKLFISIKLKMCKFAKLLQ